MIEECRMGDGDEGERGEDEDGDQLASEKGKKGWRVAAEFESGVAMRQITTGSWSMCQSAVQCSAVWTKATYRILWQQARGQDRQSQPR